MKYTVKFKEIQVEIPDNISIDPENLKIEIIEQALNLLQLLDEPTKEIKEDV